MTIAHIDQWCDRIINGPGGMRDYHQYEWADSGPESVAAFVLRCLANPRCADSDVVLEAIAERRAEWAKHRPECSHVADPTFACRCPQEQP